MANDDDDYIITYLNEFITNYTKEFPSRNIALTFIDSGGQSKCVTQFLQPMIPPDCAYFSKNIKRIESALSKTSGFSKSSSSSQAKIERGEQIKDLDIERAEITIPSYSRVSDFWTKERESEKLICCCARYVSLIPIYNAERYAVTLMGSVFDKSIFVASLPIISDRSIYAPMTDVESLREKLEAKIKAKVQKWRTRSKTVWNRYCSTLLHELIPQWEYWAVNPDESKPNLSQKLKQLMVTYKVYGFPLNMPFVNIKSVLSAIKSTALHTNDDTSIEFGLAVEMYPYPNNVISVWVFFVSLTKM
ncbi:Coiled-coil and C2 domain-containing protein 2A [Eumeta japonica]|uniref:Coiled-coil and C2 domain-containing protein 2A n=1 Tax=Eumeta variegata TaxID=151549 RepID=A0A4C1XKF0_EUMVA|nr:Coiled-coil and C2 domain-containing protein 2A [Eumeta japonica]